MEREMNILEIVQALLKRYKVLIAIILLFGAVGGGLSFLLNDKEHESTAVLIVGKEAERETDRINQINGEPIYEEVIEYGESNISDQTKKFYSETLTRRDLLEEVINDLNLDLETSELKKDITMEVPENSSSLYITVSSSKIKDVDVVTEKILNIFMNEVYEITGAEKIKILDAASEPKIENSVNFTKNILIFVIIGLVVAFVIILILEYLDDTVQKPTDVEKKLNLPIIGTLENEKTLVEDVKMIRTNLENSSNLKNKRTILVTSIDNNINITVELSQVLNKIKKETLLMDANFRNPELDKILSISNDYGLSNILNEDIEIEEVLKLAEKNNILTTGNSLKDSSEKLSSVKMEKLLEELKVYFDYIIINGHKINLYTDTIELSTLTDGVIILVEKNKTSLKEIKEIKRKLNNIDTNIIGVIFKEFN